MLLRLAKFTNFLFMYILTFGSFKAVSYNTSSVDCLSLCNYVLCLIHSLPKILKKDIIFHNYRNFADLCEI